MKCLISQFKNQILDAFDSQETAAGMIDVTVQMRILFNSADRNIVKAKLRYETTESSLLVTVVGLRSDMLLPFNGNKVKPSTNYLPCDIFGLVPALASIVKYRTRGLVANAIVHGDVTRLVLVFENKESSRLDKISSLAAVVYSFFKTWAEWSKVLISAVRNDPVIGSWNVDWREFLVGESGLVTMSWFHPMRYNERAIALERIVLAAKALLTSVLSTEQLTDPLIRRLLHWLTHLKPRQHVLFEIDETEEVGTF